MECSHCEKELDLGKKNSYKYDYMGNIWCTNCMEIEVKREM
ncbi:hypothetical protein [Cytobacillus purgationiresistens]|uniref:LIM zinc-binding domain-containing protein n=1 Tax=Cytobacillus purgationiresistens TaxID=863449 RepID=A0ABU0AHL7_9BACI|nr:hypothetical protein [Cytobacillus purgationiresistens]MDQ0270744.1 hypothetical protein [Cytobacillus purgationiresistens]